MVEQNEAKNRLANVSEHLLGIKEMYASGSFFVLNQGHFKDFLEDIPEDHDFFKKVMTKKVYLEEDKEKPNKQPFLLVDAASLQAYLQREMSDLESNRSPEHAEELGNKTLPDILIALASEIDTQQATLKTNIFVAKSYAKLDKTKAEAYVRNVLQPNMQLYQLVVERLKGILNPLEETKWESFAGGAALKERYQNAYLVMKNNEAANTQAVKEIQTLLGASN